MPIHIERRELYRLVWIEPVIRVAAQLGISDVGLAKTCRRYEIPRPPRGYWAQKEHGYPTTQTPLPKPDWNETITIHGLGRSASHTLAEATAQLIAAEKDPRNRIEVLEWANPRHHLVGGATDLLQRAAVDDKGLIADAAQTGLDLTVSKGSLPRAMLLVSALLNALESRSYEVGTGPTAVITGQIIRIDILEQLDTTWELPEEHDLDGPYQFGHSRFIKKQFPSGRLRLRIVREAQGRHTGGHRSWRDTATATLEPKLNAVIARMIRMAAECCGRHEGES